MGIQLSRKQEPSSTPTDGPAEVPRPPPVAPSSPSITPDNMDPQSKREPHMFKEIVSEETTTAEQVSREGIMLAGKTKKYWVDKNNNNCFMLFPRGLSITWSDDPSYWTWNGDAGTEVAELKNVCWLDINGQQELSHLTPGVTYEVVFEVMLKQGSSGWRVPVNLRLKSPGGTIIQERQENLQGKPMEQLLQLKAGDVKAHRGQSGELEVSLFEYGGHWKSGLVVKGIKITPKE